MEQSDAGSDEFILGGVGKAKLEKIWGHAAKSQNYFKQIKE
jgi:hypothetical protein